MSLDAIASAAGLPRGLHYVKAGPRKSEHQPHCWFACDDERPRWVLKFSDAGSEAQRRRLDREIELLRAVGRLNPGDPVKQRVPDLIAAGEAAERDFLVTGFESLEPASRWLARSFPKDPLSHLAWLDDALRWLGELQNHEPLKQRLGATGNQVIVHGDYSHHNFLGHTSAIRVIDWEDWRLDERRYLDVLHVAVMPTLEGGDLEARVASFRRHWLEGSPWAVAVLPRLMPFLGDAPPPSALAEHLEFQRQLTSTDSPEIGRMFALCLQSLREHDVGSTAS